MRIFSRINLIILLLVLILISLVTPTVYFAFANNSNQNFPIIVSESILQQENSSLKQALGLAQQNRVEVVRIQTFSSWDISKIKLNKGSDSGINVGQTVTDSTGKLCGKISEVDSNTSKLTTISSNDFSAPVTIGDKQYTGVLTGIYSYSAEIKWINTTENLNGSIVYSSSLSDVKPGLPIGSVANFRNDQDTSFSQAEIKDLCNIWKTNGVLVVWL